MRSLLDIIILKDGNSEGRILGPGHGIIGFGLGFFDFLGYYIAGIMLLVGGTIVFVVLGILWGLGVI